MSTPTSPVTDAVDLASRVEWARGELGLPDDVTSHDLRMAVLREVQSCQFAPHGSRSQAIRVLLGMPILDSPSSPWRLWRNAKLHAVVASFAAHFFELDCLERTLRWRGLAAKSSEFPHLQTWLLGLKSGLDVSVDTTGFEPAVAELAAILMAVFCSPPHKRGRLLEVRRIEMWGEDRWRFAAKRLLRRDPKLARLERRLVNALIGDQSRVDESAGPIKKPVKISAYTAMAGGTFLWLFLFMAALTGLVIVSSSRNPERREAERQQRRLVAEELERLRSQISRLPASRREPLDGTKEIERLQQLLQTPSPTPNPLLPLPPIDSRQP